MIADGAAVNAEQEVRRAFPTIEEKANGLNETQLGYALALGGLAVVTAGGALFISGYPKVEKPVVIDQAATGPPDEENLAKVIPLPVSTAEQPGPLPRFEV